MRTALQYQRKPTPVLAVNALLLLYAIAGIVLPAAAQTNDKKTAETKKKAWDQLPQHPRLFATAARLNAIKQQRDTVTKQLLFILRKEAEKSLTAAKIAYPNEVSNMGASRNVQGRILSLALAYRLFGDVRYLQKGKEELLQLAAVGNWGTGHFLDVGEASLAAGIGYDWLYNDLTGIERKTIEEAIKTKALLPSLQVKEESGNAGWLNGNFNWNPVCHGGLIVGALAIAETVPALAKQIVDRGIKNIPVAGDAYSPDGAFAEGPSYWSYGTSFYVLAVEALRSVFRNSAGLETIPGFLKTADYKVQMRAPSGEDFNYSDYHVENLNEPVMLWFAKELSRPDLLKEELASINNLYRQRSADNREPSGKKTNLSRHLPLQLLWWNPELLNKNSTAPAPLQWTADGLMPIGVMRSSWDDPKASFIAMKGGTPNNSHGHMDAGSFILEADGVRWALDLGTEDYNKMRAAKLDLWNYSQGSSRWTTFRVGPEGHNILRFDGERQLITGRGEVKALTKKDGVPGMVADLTSLYANKATKVSRKVWLHPDRSFSIQDEWTTKDSAVAVSFQWLTKARITKTADGLLLQQAGQSLTLKLEPSFLNGATIETEDVSAARGVQDSPNPGLSRIVIKTKSGANSQGKFFLRVVPGSVSSTAKKDNKQNEQE